MRMARGHNIFRRFRCFSRHAEPDAFALMSRYVIGMLPRQERATCLRLSAQRFIAFTIAPPPGADFAAACRY